MRSHPCIAALLSVGLAACQPDRAELQVMVTDSSGVRITITKGPERTFAEVDPQPIVTLGGADIEGPTQFFNIRGIHVDSRGNLWVADGGSAEVRIFRSDGSHWKTVGGRGEGPGEFQQIRLLGAFRGDSVALWDDANARLTILDADGEFARTISLSPGAEAPIQAVGVYGDGSLLVRQVRILLAGSLEPGKILGDTAQLLRLDADTRASTHQGSASGPDLVWTGRGLVPVPFTINTPFAVIGDAVHIAAGPDFRIRVLEAGKLSEVYGVARPRRSRPSRPTPNSTLERSTTRSSGASTSPGWISRADPSCCQATTRSSSPMTATCGPGCTGRTSWLPRPGTCSRRAVSGSVRCARPKASR